ncbi:MAG: hypothetical protein MUE41_14795 [Gemmatimonadaceae bacterium]|jgi:nucleoside phosphorylase|nr:hypothetical protein [Gemmatimonadaceae bacterium]
MVPPSRILVVAATARELAPSQGWRTLTCGVGPVDAAIASAAAIALDPPAAILHVGIAGARSLAPGTIVIGSEARYTDLVVAESFAPRGMVSDPLLVGAARTALPDAPVLPIGTSARVGGTVDCEVEAMEGFAVLRAAQQAGIPALEVRAISNAIGEPDRARWEFDAAFAALARITPVLVDAIARCVR